MLNKELKDQVKFIKPNKHPAKRSPGMNTAEEATNRDFSWFNPKTHYDNGGKSTAQNGQTA